MINKYLGEINYLYKPYKYTIKGKTLIIETKDNNKYVIKEANKKLNDYYSYLDSRGFNYYLRPLDNNINNSYNIFPYIEENSVSFMKGV